MACIFQLFGSSSRYEPVKNAPIKSSRKRQGCSNRGKHDCKIVQKPELDVERKVDGKKKEINATSKFPGKEAKGEKQKNMNKMSGGRFHRNRRKSDNTKKQRKRFAPWSTWSCCRNVEVVNEKSTETKGSTANDNLEDTPTKAKSAPAASYVHDIAIEENSADPGLPEPVAIFPEVEEDEVPLQQTTDEEPQPAPQEEPHAVPQAAPHVVSQEEDPQAVPQVEPQDKPQVEQDEEESTGSNQQRSRSRRRRKSRKAKSDNNDDSELIGMVIIFDPTSEMLRPPLTLDDDEDPTKIQTGRSQLRKLQKNESYDTSLLGDLTSDSYSSDDTFESLELGMLGQNHEVSSIADEFYDAGPFDLLFDARSNGDTDDERKEESDEEFEEKDPTGFYSLLAQKFEEEGFKFLAKEHEAFFKEQTNDFFQSFPELKPTANYEQDEFFDCHQEEQKEDSKEQELNTETDDKSQESQPISYLWHMPHHVDAMKVYEQGRCGLSSIPTTYSYYAARLSATYASQLDTRSDSSVGSSILYMSDSSEAVQDLVDLCVPDNETEI